MFEYFWDFTTLGVSGFFSPRILLWLYSLTHSGRTAVRFDGQSAESSDGTALSEEQSRQGGRGAGVAPRPVAHSQALLFIWARRGFRNKNEGAVLPGVNHPSSLLSLPLGWGDDGRGFRRLGWCLPAFGIHTSERMESTQMGLSTRARCCQIPLVKSSDPFFFFFFSFAVFLSFLGGGGGGVECAIKLRAGFIWPRSGTAWLAWLWGALLAMLVLGRVLVLGSWGASVYTRLTLGVLIRPAIHAARRQ